MNAPATERMVQLPDNPGVIRDTSTGANYHLGDAEEAAAICVLINTYHAKVASLVTVAGMLHRVAKRSKASYEASVEEKEEEKKSNG